VVGSVFLFVGFASCSIAVIRRRARVRIFVWLGFWSAMYGALQLDIRLCSGGRKDSSSGSRATGLSFRDNQSRSPGQLSEELLSQIDHWRSSATPQQDDITFVVIDVA
jgi:hypothetical protein